MSRQSESLIQQQIQKFNLQQQLHLLQQAYLANPSSITGNPGDLFQQFNTIIEQCNAKIVAETQSLEVNQQLVRLMKTRRLLQGNQAAAAATTPLNSELLNMHEMLNAQPNTSTAAQAAGLQQQQQQPQRGQLRIDQLFTPVTNRSTLSGTSNSQVQPKEEPK